MDNETASSQQDVFNTPVEVSDSTTAPAARPDAAEPLLHYSFMVRARLELEPELELEIVNLTKSPVVQPNHWLSLAI